MNLHIITKENSLYHFDFMIQLMNDEDFDNLLQESTIDDILNSDDVTSVIEESEFIDGLRDVIDPLFNMESNGKFNWNEKTCEYYDLFDLQIKDCICQVEKDSGEIITQYQCVHDDCYYSFSEDCFSFRLQNFYSGNGQPIGAQLALDMVELFMKSGQWHVGILDSDGTLISDVSKWAKHNVLDILSIKPIVWFGREDDVTDCWSITPETHDLFLKYFWNDYYEGALPYICKADEGLGIYYSVWEYGLEYDPQLFADIKKLCPINIDLPNEDRNNALYNLIISIYNDKKADGLQDVSLDLYSKRVIECEIIVKSGALNYYYSKHYKFSSDNLNHVDQLIIEDILNEDEEYQKSFFYLKESIIDNCSLSSCNDVWKTVRAAISDVQECLDESLICQIQRDSIVLKQVPFTIKLGHNYLPVEEMNNDVFIKSLVEFFKRGSWHIGYKNASDLPCIYNAMAQVIPQNGIYPVVWFNDTEDFFGKMGIWSAKQQYMLSLTWESASSFCSLVFNNNAVHNNYKNNDHQLFQILEIEFERIKSECPVHIRNDKEPVDFEELSRVVYDYTKSH